MLNFYSKNNSDGFGSERSKVCGHIKLISHGDTINEAAFNPGHVNTDVLACIYEHWLRGQRQPSGIMFLQDKQLLQFDVACETYYKQFIQTGSPNSLITPFLHIDSPGRV